MTTLEELQGVLGGVIHIDVDHRWLETSVGDLRAGITSRVLPSRQLALEVAVQSPDSEREASLFEDDPHATWSSVQPRLSHGFVYVGAASGVLFARSVGTPSLEGVVAALWSLADWARNPPADAGTLQDSIRSEERERGIRRFKLLVLLAVLLWIIISGLRSGREDLVHPGIG